MVDVPLNVDVACADGVCGRSICVIAAQDTLQVTHVVVRENQPPHIKRLVPVEQVAQTEGDSISLRCTRGELAKMEPFAVTEYHQVEIPRYVGSEGMVPYYSPTTETVTTERERIPAGGLVVRPGAEVHATDGKVGQVSELLADPDTGQITHLVLRRGHVWGRNEVLIPVPVVEGVIGDTVHLKLDSETVGRMLGIPARWRARLVDAQLVLLAIEDVRAAQHALQALRKFAREDALAILSAAVLVKDESGKVSLRETGDVHRKHGTVFGAITGGLLGLLGGPVGMVVGAAVGAAAGGVAADRIDLGFPDEYLRTVQEALSPGSAALVVLVEQEWVDELAEVLAGFEGQLVVHTLTDEVAAELADRVVDELGAAA